MPKENILQVNNSRVERTYNYNNLMVQRFCTVARSVALQLMIQNIGAKCNKLVLNHSKVFLQVLKNIWQLVDPH